MHGAKKLEFVRPGILCGVAGGLVEIAWVTLYVGVTGGNAPAVARAVTTAAGVSALLPTSSVLLGIFVHMTLALIIGIVLAFAWGSLRIFRPSLSNPYPLMLTVLAGIWAINFLVVLPIVSPAFVHIVPFTASLTSKLLFGLAAAETTRRYATLVSAPILVAKQSN